MSQISTLNSLSKILGFQNSKIDFCIKNINTLYKEKQINKSDGSYRNLNVPRHLLKSVQTQILKVLLVQHPISDATHGWVKNHSRFTCLHQHLSNKYLLTCDIEDYFDNIKYTSIYNIYNKKINCSPNVARLLTILTTHKYCLPQGAPTSPYLANIYLYSFDEYLKKFTHKRRIVYTRFGDDLIFSANYDIEGMLFVVKNLLLKYRLRIVPKKTTFSTDLNYRTTILGLIVTDKLSVPKKERKLIEAILFNIQKTGFEEQNREQIINFKQSIQGKINQVLTANNKHATKLLRYFKKF